MCSASRNEQTHANENGSELNGDAINMRYTTQYRTSVCVPLTKPIVIWGPTVCGI